MAVAENPCVTKPLGLKPQTVSRQVEKVSDGHVLASGSGHGPQCFAHGTPNLRPLTMGWQ